LPKNPTISILLATLLLVVIAAAALFLVFSVLRLFGA
jgi:hypothetical protein